MSEDPPLPPECDCDPPVVEEIGGEQIPADIQICPIPRRPNIPEVMSKGVVLTPDSIRGQKGRPGEPGLPGISPPAMPGPPGPPGAPAPGSAVDCAEFSIRMLRDSDSFPTQDENDENMFPGGKSNQVDESTAGLWTVCPGWIYERYPYLTILEGNLSSESRVKEWRVRPLSPIADATLDPPQTHATLAIPVDPYGYITPFENTSGEGNHNHLPAIIYSNDYVKDAPENLGGDSKLWIMVPIGYVGRVEGNSGPWEVKEQRQIGPFIHSSPTHPIPAPLGMKVIILKNQGAEFWGNTGSYDWRVGLQGFRARRGSHVQNINTLIHPLSNQVTGYLDHKFWAVMNLKPVGGSGTFGQGEEWPESSSVSGQIRKLFTVEWEDTHGPKKYPRTKKEGSES